MIMCFLTASVYAGNCFDGAFFDAPRNGKTYEVGSDIYTHIIPDQKDQIASISLYINGKYIRKEISFPFEWATGNDSNDKYLRNLKPGVYTLKARIKNKCGGVSWEECIFYIKYGPISNREEYCVINNPLKDFEWLKEIHKESPDHFIAMYKKKGRPLFRVYTCSLKRNYWYDCKGNQLSSSQSGARFYKYYHKPNCSAPDGEMGGGAGTDPGGQCDVKGWFKYPRNQSSYRYGKNVYVRFDVNNYKEIQQIDLYINQRFVRTERSYPFEWCKDNGDSDPQMRNLKRGTYRLKARIKSKCGQWSEVTCKFYVR